MLHIDFLRHNTSKNKDHISEVRLSLFCLSMLLMSLCVVFVHTQKDLARMLLKYTRMRETEQQEYLARVGDRYKDTVPPLTRPLSHRRIMF